VLKTRTLSYHVLGLPTPVPAIQLLYRSTSQLGEPTVNVTSVLKPLLTIGTPQVVSYQSFYDSLNPVDEPSIAISGGVSLGGAIPQVESALIGPSPLAGRTVVITDTEGENADFAAGPEYGINTLDGLKAALASSATGLSSTKKIAMIGYSGGAIATEWAAELAASYAPTVNSKLVGATMGGVLVDRPTTSTTSTAASVGRASCRWRSSASRAPSTSISPRTSPNTGNRSTRNSKEPRSPACWRSTRA
jgi:Secretory lipase